MQTRVALTLAFLLSFSPCAAPAADEATPPAKRGPEAEEFYRLHDQMNVLLAELAKLQIEYRTADEDQQAAIQQQWKDLIAKGEQIEPKLIEAAKKAYVEAPNADPKLTQFLVEKLLREKVRCDEYELAAEIGKLLMENKCPRPGVPHLAGIAAFAVANVDAAEKYLHLAESSGYYRSASKKDKSAQLGMLYLQNLANYKKAWEQEKTIRQREAEADNLPRVLLKTSKGDIELELFENQAPNAVANFISLVENGFYNDTTFHRVLPGFMAQGGDPRGTGTGGPGYSIACECYRPDHRLHFRGSLSMAHAGRDTGGSQFFLTFVPTLYLNGRHTVFGRVIGGMDVLAKLQRYDPAKDGEAPRLDKIVEAKVLRKRPHEYKPQKMPE